MHVAFVSCASLPSPAWRPGGQCLFNDPIAVFRFHWPAYPAELTRLQALLHPDEQVRADRYRLPADRNRFVAGRGLLRLLAGSYLNQPPEQVTIGVDGNLKPVVTSAPNQYVNVSHAGDWVLLAMGNVAVGIDVEEINPDFQYGDVLTATFDVVEQQQLWADADPRGRFYDGWTRKEALLKATGLGLSDDLPTVPCLDGDYQFPESVIGANGNWLVYGFALTVGYRAALAYAASPPWPRFYTIDSGFFFRFFRVP